MTRLLEISGLTVRYGALEAVRHLDLTVEQGETVALVGESGCGKSTSALALMRLLPEGAKLGGHALFEGQDLLTLSRPALRALRGAKISMIFQDPMTSLNPVLTIGAQIAESLKLHLGLHGAEARRRTLELLDMVEIPNPSRRIDEYPHQFSGGQRQRVMIAIAMACRPRLLIADEPTTALDVTVQARILSLLDQLKRELGMGLLLITHDLGVVGRWADRVAIMRHGLKVEEGSVERIFTVPAHPYTRTLLGATLNLDQNRHYRSTRLAETKLRAVPVAAPAPVASNVPLLSLLSLLSLRDIRVQYAGQERGTNAVDGVSFDIARGETLGLVGESGCGKSTLSKVILRLLNPSAGRILFDGDDVTQLGERALKPFRRRMQLVFQDPYGSLNPRHNVGDILHATLKAAGVKSRIERDARMRQIIDRVGLPSDTPARFAHEFSGGQRQRIGIARALLPQPSLLICDEPVSSLDLPIRAQILNLLVDLKAEFGLSYLFISHDLSVVRYIADRVLVMQKGRIVEQGDHREIWAQPKHPYTRSLIAAVPAPQFTRPPAAAAAGT